MCYESLPKEQWTQALSTLTQSTAFVQTVVSLSQNIVNIWIEKRRLLLGFVQQKRVMHLKIHVTTFFMQTSSWFASITDLIN